MTDKDNVQQLTDDETKIDDVETSSYMFYYFPEKDEFIHPKASADFENLWKENHRQIEEWRKSEEKYNDLVTKYIADEASIKEQYRVKIEKISNDIDRTEENKKQQIENLEKERDAFIANKLAELSTAEKTKNENKKFLSQCLPNDDKKFLENEFTPEKAPQDYTAEELKNQQTSSEAKVSSMETEYVSASSIYEMYGYRIGAKSQDASVVRVYIKGKSLNENIKAELVSNTPSGSLLEKGESGKLQTTFFVDDPETGKRKFSLKKLTDTIAENKDFKAKLYEKSLFDPWVGNLVPDAYDEMLTDVNSKLNFTTGEENAMFDISGHAQLLRFSVAATVSAEVDLTNLKAELKAEAGGTLTLASGAVDANLYFPDRLGMRWYIPGLIKTSNKGNALNNYERADYIIGYMRFRLSGELSAFVGATACISGTLSVGKATDVHGDDYMPYLTAVAAQDSTTSVADRVIQGSQLKDDAGGKVAGALVLSASAFAGARAGFGVSLELEWLKPPGYFKHHHEEQPAKPAFEVLLSGGFQIDGTAGIGAAATLHITFESGNLVAFAHAELCFGVGASGALKFNIDLPNILYFLDWIVTQLLWAGYSYLRFINDVVFEFLSELAVAVIALGEDIKEYYDTFCANLVAVLKEIGELLTIENAQRVLSKMDTWWKELGKSEMEKKCISAVDNLKNGNVNLMKFTPEAKGLLISILIYDYEVMTSGVRSQLDEQIRHQAEVIQRGKDKPWYEALWLYTTEFMPAGDAVNYAAMNDLVFTRSKRATFEERCTAILKICDSFQNQREMECVLKSIRFIDKNGEKSPPVNDKNEGFNRIARYLMLDMVIDPTKCSSNTSQLTKIMSRLDEGAPNVYGYGLCYNDTPSYQLRNGINPQYDLAQCCTLDSGTYSGNLGRSR